MTALELDRLLDALRAGDDARAWSLVVQRGARLPTPALRREHVPSGAHWFPTGRLQAFALSFDGYGHAEHPWHLLAAARERLAAGESLESMSIDDLRCALFALQREFRDAYGEPEPALVDALLAAIAGRLAKES